MNRPEPVLALEIRGLAKRFDKLAVDGLDLTVRTGEFYALLGPNGAGKTTTMRVLTGLISADSGSVEIFGQPKTIDASDAVLSRIREPAP